MSILADGRQSVAEFEGWLMVGSIQSDTEAMSTEAAV